MLIILDPPLQQSEWVSFRPNHNPKKSFSFKGNYLSLLFNNKRLVTYTGDLCSVLSKQLKLWFFGSGAATRLGAGQIEIFYHVKLFGFTIHKHPLWLNSLLAFCGGSTAMKLPYTCVNFLKKSNFAWVGTLEIGESVNVRMLDPLIRRGRVSGLP